jgi:hypothetical protein
MTHSRSRLCGRDSIRSPPMAVVAATTPAPRPRFVVDVPVGGAPAIVALGAVDACLAAAGRDARVRVLVPRAHPEREAIDAACEADPRISVIVGDGAGSTPDAEVLVRLPPGARPGEATLDAIARLVHEEPARALEVSVPGPLGPIERLGLAARLPRRTLVRAAAGTAANGPRPRRIPGPRVGLGSSRSSRVEQSPPPPGPLSQERAEHLRNRARSATYRARADRSLKRLLRERRLAEHQRARVALLEERLAARGPRQWVAWRGRQLGRLAAAAPAAIARAAREPLRRCGWFVTRARASLATGWARRPGRSTASAPPRAGA